MKWDIFLTLKAGQINLCNKRNFLSRRCEQRVNSTKVIILYIILTFVLQFEFKVLNFVPSDSLRFVVIFTIIICLVILLVLLLLLLLRLTVIVFSTGESSSYTSTDETKKNIYINEIRKNTVQKIQITVNTLTYITETSTQYDPETKQQSMEWRHSCLLLPAPKNSECKNPQKILASIFWDQDGILHIDYLPKGRTTNAEYYLSLLVQLKDILKEKRLHWKVINGVIFLKDNAPAHWALATQK